MATFEAVDGDTVNDVLWEYEKEEEVMFELQNTGYDSNQFQASFGFPLYVLGYSIILLIFLPPINCLRSKCCNSKDKNEGGEDEGEIQEKGKEVDKKHCCTTCKNKFCNKFCNT
jgi:hypothetical protein